MRETGVVIDKNGQPIFWHVPNDRTTVALPDSRTLWDVIWDNRHNLQGVAHTHPGSGVPGPSYTDVTTFAAIESSLGQRLDWWIASDDRIVVLRWAGPHALGYQGAHLNKDPLWVPELRRLSQYHQTQMKEINHDR